MVRCVPGITDKAAVCFCCSWTLFCFLLFFRGRVLRDVPVRADSFLRGIPTCLHHLRYCSRVCVCVCVWEQIEQTDTHLSRLQQQWVLVSGMCLGGGLPRRIQICVASLLIRVNWTALPSPRLLAPSVNAWMNVSLCNYLCVCASPCATQTVLSWKPILVPMCHHTFLII